MLVQTFSPDHPAIRAAVRHDFAAFAAGELPIREMLRYPPFASMIRLVVRGPVEAVAAQFAARTWPSGCGRRWQSLQARGPGAWARPRRRLPGCGANIRFQIQAHGPDGEKLRAAVRQATAGLKPPEDVQWIVDVDPLEML